MWEITLTDLSNIYLCTVCKYDMETNSPNLIKETEYIGSRDYHSRCDHCDYGED